MSAIEISHCKPGSLNLGCDLCERRLNMLDAFAIDLQDYERTIYFCVPCADALASTLKWRVSDLHTAWAARARKP